MIMVASTTLGVSTVGACYHGRCDSRQHRCSKRSDPTDQISLDALAGEGDDGMERMPAERLLHLAEQRVEALHRLHDVTRVRTRWRFDIGERHTGRPFVCGTDLFERQRRHRLQAVLALQFDEAAHRGSQPSVAMRGVGK